MKKLLLLPLFLFVTGALTAGVFEQKYGCGIVSISPDTAANMRFYAVPNGMEAQRTFRFVRNPQMSGEVLIAERDSLHWLQPLAEKLNYSLLQFTCVEVKKDWYRVRVNEHTGETHWILQSSYCKMERWEQLLLHTTAIRRKDAAGNPLRAKPSLKATRIPFSGSEQFTAVSISGQWMKVSATTEDGIVLTGWIRWRDDEKILIDYSLLC